MLQIRVLKRRTIQIWINKPKHRLRANTKRYKIFYRTQIWSRAYRCFRILPSCIRIKPRHNNLIFRHSFKINWSVSIILRLTRDNKISSSNSQILRHSNRLTPWNCRANHLLVLATLTPFLARITRMQMVLIRLLTSKRIWSPRCNSYYMRVSR